MSYSGNLLVENRNGLMVSSTVWEATGTAERDAAMAMLQQVSGSEQVTVGGDKRFDTAEFVRACRNLRVTPHVAQNLGRRGGSAMDGRNTHHATRGLPDQPKEKEAHRRMFWLAEDDCVVAQSAAARNAESGLDIGLHLRRLQPGTQEKPDGCYRSSAVSPGW